MRNKSFALLEVGNHECPMIGTIANISDTEEGKRSFEKKFREAVCSHFDVLEFEHDEIPDLFDGGHSYTVGIEIDGLNYEVEIMETWVY